MTDRCRLCHASKETLEHAMGGCNSLNGLVTYRHDYVLRLIDEFFKIAGSEKGASGSKSGKKTKAPSKKTGMSSESHESLLAVSTQQLEKLVSQAVTERFATLQLSRPPTPSPLPPQTAERMDQPIDPTPSVEDLLVRLQTVVDDKKLRTRDLEEARILLLWKTKTEVLTPEDSKLLYRRLKLMLTVTFHGWSVAITDQKKTDDLLANLDVVALPPAQPRTYRRNYATTHKKKFTKKKLTANTMVDTSLHTPLLDSEYEPLPENIADLVLELEEDPTMDLNHIQLFPLHVQRPTRGRSGRNPPAWVTLSEDGNEDEQNGTADEPKGAEKTNPKQGDTENSSDDPATDEEDEHSDDSGDSATMFTDAIPGRIGWIDCKGSSQSLKSPLLIHLAEGLALVRAVADHVNRYPTLKRLLIHCDNTVIASKETPSASGSQPSGKKGKSTRSIRTAMASESQDSLFAVSSQQLVLAAVERRFSSMNIAPPAPDMSQALVAAPRGDLGRIVTFERYHKYHE
ncbi:hypothetical protein GQR58_025130 [Nymphon striatum]|nr:hypothetical protein GQR58_025130 [Nymphon striatum]